VLVSLILAAGIALGIWAIAINTGGVKVPNVVGAKRTDAEAELQKAGLTMKVTKEEVNAEQPKDTITSQDPAAGTKLSKGGVVSVVVSKGPELVQVPNVVGMTPDAADTALSAVGLKLGDKTDSYGSVAAGKIQSQNPAAATPLP
jgi:beta-lactam-binding protein with PASTA domain